MARFGIPSQGRDALAYVDSRLTGVPTVDSARDPTVNDTNYPIQTIWRNSTLLKECILVGFTNGEAQWKCFTDSDGTMLELTADDTNAVQPLAGNINIFGDTQLSGVLSQPVFTDGATDNTLKVQVQLGSAVGPTPVDFNDAGLLSANNNQFVVDATSGMFSLKGDTSNQALQTIDVDANTAPGTDPVVASASGQISILGSVVNAHSVPIETHSRAVNSANVEVQVASTVNGAPGNKNAAGLVQFSDMQFVVDSDGYTTLAGTTETANTFTNLGISYDSGTGVFTITDANGAALSAANPGFVTLKSKVNPGQLVTYSVETSYTFEDANGTSDLTNNLFGFTTSIATNQDVPFLIYFVSNDAETAVTPMISRSPFSTYSPGVADIGKPSSAIADNNLDFWAIDDGITVGDYDSNPCLRIGLFRMRMDASDDWTVQTLDFSPGNLDGVQSEIPQRVWDMPTGQFGAAAGNFLRDNGGTAPTWSTSRVTYQFILGQIILVRYYFSGDGGTDGSGAVNTQMVLPFMALSVPSGGQNLLADSFLAEGSSLTVRTGIHQVAYNDNITFFNDYLGVLVTNAAFGNGDRSLRGQILYRIGGT